MAQSTYTIDQFVTDVRQVFAEVQDARARAQGVAKHMKDLLAASDLTEEFNRRAGGRRGRIDLHIDEKYGHPAPGFCLMTSISGPSSGEGLGGRLPHDHGASFVGTESTRERSSKRSTNGSMPKRGSGHLPSLEKASALSKDQAKWRSFSLERYIRRQESGASRRWS